MIIYSAKNKKTGKQYIGQTIQTLENRIKRHLNGYDSYFCRALKKYGLDNFELLIIDECSSKSELDEKEKYYIQFYNTVSPNGYNLTLGGEGTHGWKPTDENKKNISEGNKRYWNSVSKDYKKQWGLKMSKQNSGKNNPMYGKKRPEISGENNPSCRAKVREKISKSNKGKNNPFYNKKHSKETLGKISRNVKLAWARKRGEIVL